MDERPNRCEELRRRARRAYERGRVRWAAVRALPALGVVLVALGTEFQWGSLAVGLLLYGLCFGLLYAGGERGRVVPTSLVAGLAPLLALGIARAVSCSEMACTAACGLATGVAGVGVGAAIGWRAASSPGRRAEILLAGWGVALLAGLVGCWSAGLGDVLGLAVAMALTAPVAWLPRPQPQN